MIYIGLRLFGAQSECYFFLRLEDRMEKVYFKIYRLLGVIYMLPIKIIKKIVKKII